MSVILFLAGASSYRNYLTGRKKIIEKIKSPDASPPYEQPSDVFSPVEAGLKGRFLGFIGSLGNWIKPDSDDQISNMRATLMQAGYRRLNALPVYFGFKLFLAAALPIGFLNMKALFLEPIPYMNLMIILIALGLTGFLLPNLWLRYRISDRKRQIFEGFPDALDLLVVCVEAGMGMDAAINRVGEEMKLRNKIIGENLNSRALS
jgi:tight adherence protein C